MLIASTGVIGRSYPMDHIRAGLAAIPSPLPGTDAGQVARGIMTTDTVPKTASATVGNARIVGVAKGVGMIEPNMATMIAMFFTDAALSAPALDAVFRRVIDRTLNCVSIDTDTSTSDTAVIIANGVAGTVDDDAFEAALCSVAESLTRQIARDGEGATTLLEVTVDGATSTEQARRVARAIVNSPLVKTAVHGADPNWGRVAMAVGKCTTSDEVDQQAVIIAFEVGLDDHRARDLLGLVETGDHFVVVHQADRDAAPVVAVVGLGHHREADAFRRTHGAGLALHQFLTRYRQAERAQDLVGFLLVAGEFDRDVRRLAGHGRLNALLVFAVPELHQRLLIQTQPRYATVFGGLDQ